MIMRARRPLDHSRSCLPLILITIGTQREQFIVARQTLGSDEILGVQVP